MKLYRAENGYCGNGNVHCYVIASNDKRAIELATESFKNNSEGYDEDYYKNINVEIVFDDTSIECHSEPTD